MLQSSIMSLRHSYLPSFPNYPTKPRDHCCRGDLTCRICARLLLSAQHRSNIWLSTIQDLVEPQSRLQDVRYVIAILCRRDACMERVIHGTELPLLLCHHTNNYFHRLQRHCKYVHQRSSSALCSISLPYARIHEALEEQKWFTNLPLIRYITEQFVEFYYNTFDSQRANLGSLYVRMVW